MPPKIKILARTVRALLWKDRPYFATFYVTSRCNFKCRMCNIWKKKTKDLRLELVFQIIDRLDRLGITMLQLTGGEPFLRNDLTQIIAYAASKGMLVGVVTNGSGSPRAYAKLRDVNIAYLGVSLHSHLAQTHDRICGRGGGWKKAVNTVLLLKKMGLPASINCTINSRNIRHFSKTLAFLSSFGVGVGLIPLVNSESQFRSGLLACKLKKSEAKRKFSIIKAAGQYAHFIRSDRFINNAYLCTVGTTPKWNCLAGTLFCSVASDGTFALCHDIPTRLSLLDPHFDEKYFSKRTQQEIATKRKKCAGCMYSCYYDAQKALENPAEGLTTLLRFLQALTSKSI